MMYPYLALKREIMGHFVPILEGLIEHDRNVIEVTSKHSAIYLLLLSSSHKVCIVWLAKNFQVSSQNNFI